MNEPFRRFARWVSTVAGSPNVFVIAIAIVFIWAFTGPLFGFSDTWQLFINTGTTILTFLMVFLIQNTQNRDSHAAQLKLDELIHAIKEARNDLIDIEDTTDAEISRLDKEFEEIRTEQRR
jgi:low affinity Fe/Cu permease